jgi:hypothetical protein
MVAPPDPEEPPAAAGPAAVRGGTGKAAARGRYRDAFGHRDLRILVAAFLVDQVGSWSYIVVISVYCAGMIDLGVGAASGIRRVTRAD